MVLCMCVVERRVGEVGVCEGETGFHVPQTGLQLPIQMQLAGLKLRILLHPAEFGLQVCTITSSLR